jgi:hypothetical protein
MTTREVIDLIAIEVGHLVRIRDTPKAVLRALGLVNPTIRALAEMEHQFTPPFLLDTSKYVRTFGLTGTSMGAAVSETVLTYRQDEKR